MQKSARHHFNEVAITRRVTREGSSDYFINGKASRLKDIQLTTLLPIQGGTCSLLLYWGELIRFYRLTQPSDTPSSKKLPESLYQGSAQRSPQQAGAS